MLSAVSLHVWHRRNPKYRRNQTITTTSFRRGRRRKRWEHASRTDSTSSSRAGSICKHRQSLVKTPSIQSAIKLTHHSSRHGIMMRSQQFFHTRQMAVPSCLIQGAATHGILPRCYTANRCAPRGYIMLMRAYIVFKDGRE